MRGELAAALVCREEEMAWLEGAWLLTFRVELLASKWLSLLILPTVLSRTAAVSELVKDSSIWEERSCWCALGAARRSSRSSTAQLLGWTRTVHQGCLWSRAKPVAGFLPLGSLAGLGQVARANLDARQGGRCHPLQPLCSSRAWWAAPGYPREVGTLPAVCSLHMALVWGASSPEWTIPSLRGEEQPL